MNAPAPDKIDDLNLSHAFLNALSSSYQGMYTYENVYGTLTRSAERDAKMASTAKVLDRINEWWGMFKRHEPLMRRPRNGESITGEAARAWHLLDAARGRLESLATVLLQTTSVEALLKSHDDRSIRVAAFCEAAYSRDHFVKGLVAYGEIMGREEVADRWRQHTLHTLNQTGRANGLFARFEQLGERIDEDTAAELLDITLITPMTLFRQSVDLRGVFGLVRGGFDYEDAGIPEEEAEKWQGRGFAAGDAAHWRTAGMSPEESLQWMHAGVPDPTAAAGFAWRGISIEVARKWAPAGFNGETAAYYLAQGIDEPSRIPKEA